MSRKAAPQPIDETTSTAETPGVMPPPGVDADIETKVKYRRRIDPEDYRQPESGERFSDLEDLAADEARTLDPPDALSEFTERWVDYRGFSCVIVRLPDPAERRMMNSRYIRPNLTEHERLGSIPFDPVNLEDSIRMINGDSGGVFRIWLVDHNGERIPGARLDRLAIADPPNGAGRNAGQAFSQQPQPSNYGQPAPQIHERPQSESEKQLQRLQTRLLETALERAMNPPQPPTAPAPLAPEDQITLLLVKEGGILRTVTERIAGLVQQPDQLAQPSTWKDKLIELAAQNPTLVARVNDTLDRAINRLFGPGPAAMPAPEYYPPAEQPAQHAARPQSNDNLPPDAPTTDDDMQEDDEDMALLEDIVNLLSGDEQLTATNPVFAQLRKEYPERFPYYVKLIAQTSNTDTLITFLNTVTWRDPVYHTLLNGALKQHLHSRIGELRQLCIDVTARAAAAATPAPSPAPAPPAPDVNESEPDTTQ